VADERDDAKKEREEVKWQARQAEKRTAAAEEQLECVQQASATLPGPLCNALENRLAWGQNCPLYCICRGTKTMMYLPDDWDAMDTLHGYSQEQADLMEKVARLEAEVAERTSSMSAEAGAIALAAEAARAELAAAQLVRYACLPCNALVRGEHMLPC
jgi:hypothetical protein